MSGETIRGEMKIIEAILAIIRAPFKLWTNLQWRLASGSLKNPVGNRSANLEQTIYHLQKALEIYTREAFPQEWAETQNNLGIGHH